MRPILIQLPTLGPWSVPVYSCLLALATVAALVGLRLVRPRADLGWLLGGLIVLAGALGAVLLFRFQRTLGPWSIPLHSYGVLLVLGCFICLWLCERRTARVGLEPGTCWDIGFWAVISGVVGARLMACLENWEQATDGGRQLWRIFAIWEGGLTFYGGFLGAIAAMIIFCRLKRLGVAGWIKIADLGASTLALGLAFGRLGCTLNGCCHGRLAAPGFTWWPLAMTFPPESHAHLYQIQTDLLQHHPGWTEEQIWEATRALLAGHPTPPPLPAPVYFTQLYEIVFCLAIFAFLYFWLWPRRRFDGQVALGFLILYPIGRFAEEFFRADNERFGGLLTISQIISLGLLATVLPLYVWFRRRARAASAPAPSATLSAGKSSAASADSAG